MAVQVNSRQRSRGECTPLILKRIGKVTMSLCVAGRDTDSCRNQHEMMPDRVILRSAALGFPNPTILGHQRKGKVWPDCRGLNYDGARFQDVQLNLKQGEHCADGGLHVQKEQMTARGAQQPPTTTLQVCQQFEFQEPEERYMRTVVCQVLEHDSNRGMHELMAIGLIHVLPQLEQACSVYDMLWVWAQRRSCSSSEGRPGRKVLGVDLYV